jgi:hypothetical protein
MRKIAIAFVTFAIASAPAWAEWEREVETDAFTGNSVVLVTNTGQILDGEAGTTALIWREAEGKSELYWHNSSTYVCDTKMDVQIRFGDGTPEKVYVTGSTSNKAVFFSQPQYVLSGMARTGKVLLKLTDHCGNLIVSQFEGDPTASIEGFDIFREETGWKVDSMGYVTKSTGPAAVKFRRIVTGAEDFYFTIETPQFKGKPASFSAKLPAKLKVNGTTLKMEGHHAIDTSDVRNFVSEGRVNLLLGGQLGIAKLAELLGDERKVTIEFNGTGYEVDLTGFEDAFKFG